MPVRMPLRSSNHAPTHVSVLTCMHMCNTNECLFVGEGQEAGVDHGGFGTGTARLRHQPQEAGVPTNTMQCLYASTKIGISPSPTACPLRGYGRGGTQNDRHSEAVILITGTPYPRNGHAIGDAEMPIIVSPIRCHADYGINLKKPKYLQIPCNASTAAAAAAPAALCDMSNA